jgi:hypothetical protein
MHQPTRNACATAIALAHAVGWQAQIYAEEITDDQRAFQSA